MSNQPGDFCESNNDLFPQDPNTLLDLSDPEAWKLPGQDGDDEATVHADMEISDVYCHLEQAQHLSPDQQQAAPTPNAVATGPAALTDDNSIETGDVDQFMERTLEDDQMKQFMGTATLDIPWCQNVTNEASGLQENQRDADWCEHCQSICITKTDYRLVSASARVATLQTSFQATRSISMAAAPNTDRNHLPRQKERAGSAGDLGSHDQAVTNPLNDTSTSVVSLDSPFSTATPQRPMLCKPLTAYNYFYRVERDSIVNGMTCATDPLPPVDLDVSLKKQEKLLRQHW
jgi:hypothetical protein